MLLLVLWQELWRLLQELLLLLEQRLRLPLHHGLWVPADKVSHCSQHCLLVLLVLLGQALAQGGAAVERELLLQRLLLRSQLLLTETGRVSLAPGVKARRLLLLLLLLLLVERG